MLSAIKYGLANLTNLQGRDARQTFWYYILFIVVIQFGIGIIASIPMYISIFTSVFDAMSQGMTEEAAMRAMVEDMAGQIRTQVIVGMVIGVIAAGMIVASFVRRLHDAGFSGWIVLIPLATQAFSIAYSFSYLDNMEAMMLDNMANASAAGGDPFAMQAQMGVYGMVGWIGYLLVIIFGALKSQDGPNQYGEEPVRF